jgi:NTE family protein
MLALHMHKHFLKALAFSWAFFISISTLGQTKPVIKNLVFEGGGVRGLAYAGAYQVLDSAGYLQNLERVGGTSVGAIAAMLIALNYTPQEIVTELNNLPIQKFNDGGGFFIGGLIRLNKKLGYYNGDKFLQWAAKKVKAKTGSTETTLGEMRRMEELNFKHLYTVATNLTNQQALIISHENFPDMRIIDAVRASMSIPLYFKPVIITPQGKSITKKQMIQRQKDSLPFMVLVDGGLILNYPITIFDSAKYYNQTITTTTQQNPETLGLLLELPNQLEFNKNQTGAAPIDIDNWLDIINASYITVIDKPAPEILDTNLLKRTLFINNKNINPKLKKMKRSTRLMLIHAGEQGAREYINKFSNN